MRLATLAAMLPPKFRSESLELGSWSFSGAWSLELGYFHVVAPSVWLDAGMVTDASFAVILFHRSFIKVT